MNNMIKKKNYGGDDSENEFSVDEPEELQGSDDDWTPGTEGGGRRTSRRLRNSAKKPRLAEPSSSEDEFDSEDERPKKRGKATTPKKGRGRPPASSKPSTPVSIAPKSTPKSADNIVSCEATSTTGAMNSVVTEKEYSSGAFVVLKTDFAGDGDPPIWKIDGKALLQKYIPFQQDGKTLYKNTSTYSGWSINNKDMYYPAPIVFKMQNRKESVVEFLRENVKVDTPAAKSDGDKAAETQENDENEENEANDNENENEEEDEVEEEEEEEEEDGENEEEDGEGEEEEEEDGEAEA